MNFWFVTWKIINLEYIYEVFTHFTLFKIYSVFISKNWSLWFLLNIFVSDLTSALFSYKNNILCVSSQCKTNKYQIEVYKSKYVFVKRIVNFSIFYSFYILIIFLCYKFSNT